MERRHLAGRMPALHQNALPRHARPELAFSMPESFNLSFASEHDSLSVRHFTISERMSAPFEVSLVAMSRLDDIDFETIIGQPASFRLQHTGDGSASSSRSWSG